MNVRGNVKFSSDLNSVMKPHMTFKDPVDKLRVSTPQALMDTDFEYSLQSTKWESVQVQNNIPGIYQRANEPAYQGPAIISIVKTQFDGAQEDTTSVTEMSGGSAYYLNGNNNINYSIYYSQYISGNTWSNKIVYLPFTIKIKGIEYKYIYVSSHGFFSFGSNGYRFYKNLQNANEPPEMTVKLFNFEQSNSSNNRYARGRLLRIGYREIEPPYSGVTGKKFILRLSWNGYSPHIYTGTQNNYPEGAWTAEVHFYENESYIEIHYDKNWGGFNNTMSHISDGKNNTILGKWPSTGTDSVRSNQQHPYEVRGTKTSFRVDFFSQNRDILKITVDLVQSGREFTNGMPIILKQTNDPTYIDGSYLIISVFNTPVDDNGLKCSFAVSSKTPDDYNNNFLLNNDYTTIYTGGFFNSSSILYTSIKQVIGTKDIEIIFPYPHSLFVNSKIYIVDETIFDVTPWTGSHVISSIINDYKVRYHSNTLDIYTLDNDLHTLGNELPIGSYIYPNQKTFLYVRNEGVSQHRFFDGGVQINPETNSPNTQIIRQTRKYFRYQSGKGIQFSSGILFSPNYDIISLSINHNNGEYANDLYSIFDIIIETDQEHGFTSADLYREGALINIYGLEVLNGINPYNLNYRVQSISGPKTFTVSLLTPTTFLTKTNLSDLYLNINSNILEVSIIPFGVNEFIYSFNNQNYESYNYIGLEKGIYTFNNIPLGHPIGFVINDNSKFEVTSGTLHTGSEKIIDGIIMSYYTGNITIQVKGDFGTISYSCYNHGYMGGENRLKYRTDIINNNDIYTESRLYPPARILNNQQTYITGYSYGNGLYKIKESLAIIETGYTNTLYQDLEDMRVIFLNYTYTSFTNIKSTIENAGYKLIATPKYGNIAERLGGENNITSLGKFNITEFDSGSVLQNSTGFNNIILNDHPFMVLALFDENGLVGIASMLFKDNITQTLKGFFFPGKGQNDGHNLYTYVLNADGTEIFDTTGTTKWNFANDQFNKRNANITGSNGYYLTSRFSFDDGVWGFNIGGEVDGNSPGPALTDSGSYGIQNYNFNDDTGYYMWNGKFSKTTYAMYVFVRTEQYQSSGNVAVEQLTYGIDEGPAWNAFNSNSTIYSSLNISYNSDTFDYISKSLTEINGLDDLGAWVKIILPVEINLTKYIIKRRPSPYDINAPSKYKIYGSKDDINWVLIVNKEENAITYTNNEYEDLISSNATFNYFALVVTSLIGNGQILNIDQWYIYGKEIYNINPFSNNIDSYLQYEYKDTIAERFTNVSGWRLVRFLPNTSTSWYSVNDNALGTSPPYGIAYDITNEWSIDFGTYDEMCFSTYSFSHWLYCPKSSVEGYYDNIDRIVYKSSNNLIQHNVKWIHNNGNSEHPFITIFDNSSLTNQCLYAENNFADSNLELLSGYGGMCVWVRNSQDIDNDYTVYDISTSNSLDCDILVVGGGGAGGFNCGGGGGGGSVNYLENVTLNGQYKIKVGRGGLSSYNITDYTQLGKSNGEGSSIIDLNNNSNLLQSNGGGSGSYSTNEVNSGNNGGSGGGASQTQNTYGTINIDIKTGIFQNAITYSSNGMSGDLNFAGGGGGAGGTNIIKTKNGAPGFSFNITENIYYYGAGGGGASTIENGGNGGLGGGGGGGSSNNIGGFGGINGIKNYNTLEGGIGENGGDSTYGNGGNGASNTGSGGGASANNNEIYLGGNGGSGVVIIKYKSLSTTNRTDLFSLPGIKDFSPGGIGRIELKQWNDACVRSGLFDYQNGMFFEYDGSNKLALVKRSSTEQIAGRLSIDKYSTRLQGINTKFKTQLDEGAYIVLKGDTYLITKIISDTELYVAPGYKANGFTNYKTVKINETRVYQDDFNVDKLDGTGPSNYNMNINKMQMIFIDYSWYGAGKIRFGIRGEDGDIIYFHQLKQNNINTEAYMRSGNIPGRFEISTKSKLCSLQSRISNNIFESSANMCKILKIDKKLFPNKGRIIINNEYIEYEIGEDDDIYTTLIFKNRNVKGRSELISADINDTIISFNQNCSPSLSHWGVSCIMDGGFDIDKSYLFTATSQNYIEINADKIDTAILSIRLAPSVDYGIPGFFGVRNLINRSALALYSVGIGTYGASHIQCIVKINCESKAFADNNNWLPTGNGSIAQYLDHSILTSTSSSTQFADEINSVISGDSIASFICEGSSSRYSTTEQIISTVRELSNSILGGPNAYPDGPDTLTIFLRRISGASTSAFARISWSEAQG